MNLTATNRKQNASIAMVGLIVAATASPFAFAEDPDLARLAEDLTPVGAERQGNANGTIPAWDGGIATWPEGYEPGDRHIDPFADEEPLFEVNASNISEYELLLGEGQIAFLKRYPESAIFRVYPTHRSASFPQRVYEKTAENALTGQLASEGNGVTGVAEGFPFPFADSAQKLIWNHKLKYKGTGSIRYRNLVAPTASGDYTLVRVRTEVLGEYYREGATIESINNILLYFRQEITAPARLAGTRLLVHETLNPTVQARNAWVYNPGRRRVVRAPNVAYDNTSAATDGLAMSDMVDMFNGALDRYDWALLGKREMLVPYNAYRAHSGELEIDDLVRAGHLNPQHLRYERHRVWVIEANLKEELRHIHPRRMFYLDEDSYQIVMADHYDKRGELWRYSEAHGINYYEVPTYWTTIEIHHDLQSGRYAAYGLDNQDRVPSFNMDLPLGRFSPSALRSGSR